MPPPVRSGPVPPGQGSMTEMSDSDRQAELASTLKHVLRHMPAPVGIITGCDADSGDPIGLVMSAIMPMSLDPAAIVVAINRDATSHKAILQSGRYAINLLSPEQAEHIEPFLTPARRDERFRTPGWRRHDETWIIDGAPAAIICTIDRYFSHGTHDLLVGVVQQVVTSGETSILSWCNGALGTHAPLAAEATC